MIYPSFCLKVLKENIEDIANGKIYFYDPLGESVKKRSFSVVFKISDEAGKQIEKVLNEAIPSGVRSKIYFQPSEGFHFTIQWTPGEDLETAKASEVVNRLKLVLAKYPPIIGDLYLPFFGRAGLYGLLCTKTNTEFVKIRQEIHEWWSKLGLKTGLDPKDYHLGYISTARYIRPFSKEEIKALSELKAQKLPGFKLDEVWMVLNDKFMTPGKIEILQKITLKEIQN